MAFTIAFAGKGGTGKTTLSGMAVRYLVRRRFGPVLAVDADPNSCLDQALGVTAHAAVGTLREQSLEAVRRGERPGGLSIEEVFDYQMHQALVEADGFDLLVMGRPEGPGCYCAANNIIRRYIDKLSSSYVYVVIDNEAGLEHLSRRMTNRVDLMVVMSDPTVNGIVAARRIGGLVDELRLDVSRMVMVINRAKESDNAVGHRARDAGLSIAGFIPEDPKVTKIDMQGRSVFSLEEDSAALTVFSGILDTVAIP